MKKKYFDTPLEWTIENKEIYHSEIIKHSTDNTTLDAYDALLDERGYDTIVTSLGIQSDYDYYINNVDTFRINNPDQYLEFRIQFNRLVIYKICTLDGLLCPLPPWDPPYPYKVSSRIKRLFKDLKHQDMLALAQKNDQEKAYKLIIEQENLEAAAQELNLEHLYQAYIDEVRPPDGHVRIHLLDQADDLEMYLLTKICFPEELDILWGT